MQRLLLLLTFLLLPSHLQAQEKLFWFNEVHGEGSTETRFEIHGSTLNGRAQGQHFTRLDSLTLANDFGTPVYANSTYVYFNANGIRRVERVTGAIELLVHPSENESISNIEIDDARGLIFYSTNQEVRRFDIATSESILISELNQLDPSPIALDSDNEKVYFTRDDYSLFRADYNGENSEELRSNRVRVFALDLNQNRIIFSGEQPSNTISALNLETREESVLYETNGLPGISTQSVSELSYEVSSSSVFWIDRGFSVRTSFSGIFPSIVPITRISKLNSSNEAEVLVDGVTGTTYSSLRPISEINSLYYTETSDNFTYTHKAIDIDSGETCNGFPDTRAIVSEDRRDLVTASNRRLNIADITAITCNSYTNDESLEIARITKAQLAVSGRNNKLYWTQGAAHNESLYSANVSTDFTVETELQGRTRISDIVASRTRDELYFSDAAGIHRFNTSDASVSTLANTETSASALALSADSTALYWLERGDEENEYNLNRYIFDSNENETVFTISDEVTAIAVDVSEGFLFRTDGVRIVRTTLLGVEAETIYELPEPSRSLDNRIQSLQIDTQSERLYAKGAGQIIRLEYDNPTPLIVHRGETTVRSDFYLATLTPATKATPYDFDGDGVSDYAIYRRFPGGSGGEYFVRWSSEAQSGTQVHHFTSSPILADLTGDGKTDLGVLGDQGNGFLYWKQGAGFTVPWIWGLQSDIPAPTDFDGDNIDDLTVYRPLNVHNGILSLSAWYMYFPNQRAFVTESFGLEGDLPVANDFDGDGLTDFAVWRPSLGFWIIKNSGHSYGRTDRSVDVYQWGLPGDIPLTADLDGDGRSELIVWRPSNGTWYVRNVVTGEVGITQWGLPGDQPRIADYNGDGILDFTVYRENPIQGWGPRWYTNFRNGESQVVQWGLPGDLIP